MSRRRQIETWPRRKEPPKPKVRGRVELAADWFAEYFGAYWHADLAESIATNFGQAEWARSELDNQLQWLSVPERLEVWRIVSTPPKGRAGSGSTRYRP